MYVAHKAKWPVSEQDKTALDKTNKRLLGFGWQPLTKAGLPKHTILHNAYIQWY